MTVHSEQIRIRGLVQGVGFRPTIWQTAHELGIHGEVRNDGSGVVIIAQSSPDLIDQMMAEISANQPPLARIDSIERQTFLTDRNFDVFSIEQSISNEIRTAIVADAATCSLCLDDIYNRDNRRHGYAFTNCTHCGPRLSIVDDIPYDRANTSMAVFIQCQTCQQEYDNPEDRRFHAQPNACPDCGPHLRLCDPKGKRLNGDPISVTGHLIKQGHIVAIKGIGGFQLACDADNNLAVTTLRERKRRPDKALALMATSISQVKQYCVVSDDEKRLLESSSAPIVLLARKENSVLSNSIAPGQNSLGFMLPNTPLHHSLMQQLDFPVVLTSGNASEEPQCIDNEDALSRLGSIADFFLLNNRDILSRIDDSVVRVINCKTHFLRRARGYAPAPVTLPDDLVTTTSILACGGELKNTFALLRNDQVTLSQHMGNLENSLTYDDYCRSLALYKRLYQFEPQTIAVDKHPEYLSSKYGRAYAQELDIPCFEIQHHHAHIAACLADNDWKLEDGSVIGIALDGLGFGADTSIWGGEIMIADYLDFERVARFKPVAMPGGSQAILQPWRNTYSQLSSCLDWSAISEQYANLELVQFLKKKPLATFDQMILSGLNTPMTSSCGRLFDAVAAAVGICRDGISYEGQAAIEFENRVNQEELLLSSPYRFELSDGDLMEINPQTMWLGLLEDIQSGLGVSTIAARFHLGLANILVKAVARISKQTGIQTVALSGGVFQNRTLFKLCIRQLEHNQLTPLFHQQIPANDGGLALGQAVIAAAQIRPENQREQIKNA